MSGTDKTPIQPKGGRHQRKRRLAEAQDDPSGPTSSAPMAFRTKSKLARWLIEEYHFGFLSAAQINRCAILAHDDGIDNGVLAKLASFGSNGEFPNKVAHEPDEYIKECIRPVDFPKPQAHDIPLKICKGPQTGFHILQQYYNLPHVWFAFLYKHFRQIYETRVRGDARVLCEFWNKMDPRDPRLKSFAFLRDKSVRAKTYPLMLHGDGVPCTNKNSLECLRIESLPAKFSADLALASRDVIFLVTGVMS